MPSDVMIRPGHPADVERVRAVAERTWHETYDDILGSETVDRVLEAWYEPEAIEAGIGHDAQDFVVAVDDETVVGYAHVGPHPPQRIHRLYRIYVHPDYWGEGVGKALLAEIEQALYDRDVEVYEAEVLVDNDRAVAFYEASGFERVDETESEIVGTTVPEYVFRKYL